MSHSISRNTLNNDGSFKGSYSTINSRLLPANFDPPKLRHGTLKILEPHGRNRRPKSGDFKLLAAFVAGYVGSLIPSEVYRRFIDKRGEREWKRAVRAACDIEWRAGDLREFDDIPTPNYNDMRDQVARAWPFTARYFDNAWLVKWALRTTWTNRKKAAVRVERAFAKDRQIMDGLIQPGEDDVPLALLRTRRVRASKLGESLYCVGGCQKMLALENFPNEHVGICKACIGDVPIISTSSQIHVESNCSRGSVIPTQNPPTRDPQQRGLAYESSLVNKNSARSSKDRSRRKINAALTSSVTAYSDAGEYPSERSTYGVVKPNQKRPKKRCSLQGGQSFSRKGKLGQLPRAKATGERLSEVEGLWQHLTDHEIRNLQRRRDTNAQDSQTVEDFLQQDSNTSEASTQDEDEPIPEGTIPAYLTPNIRKCIENICSTWDILHFTDIIPANLWPKFGPLWNLAVLELFLTMAHQYPTRESCEGISRKFAGLVKERRGRSNAKTQWTIRDAKATYAWARKKYGSPGGLSPMPEELDGNAIGVRSSYRQRKPSMKATFLQNTEKGKQKATNFGVSKESGELIELSELESETLSASD